MKLLERDWKLTKTSAAGAIYGALSYLEGNQLSLVDVMGLTGHAFRMNIDPKKIHPAGPTAFPGGYILRRNLCNLGYTSSLAEPETPVPPEKLAQTFSLIQDSIDKGLPAISYDLFTTEFGLIYGYDDEKQEFYAKDPSKDGTIAYEDFTERKGFLFITTISEKLAHSKYEMLRMALEMIVDHARGREWNHIFNENFVMGLEGFDAWIQVFERGNVDPLGNAYNLDVIADARQFAVKFLEELSTKWDGGNVVERNVRELAKKACKHYLISAEAFHELSSLFPFPDGGKPIVHKQTAIELLRKAKAAEVEGLVLLEKMLHLMKGYYSEKWIY
ncbi:hypothetical protein [Ornithinibacillus sp. 179-J 7C1 HS]|uniref:hypothetical protein n=1 Tax=Ornithinibacillus sp. 179-J 7C1 HS TaxID=3142384 RepID=UPI0039A3841D